MRDEFEGVDKAHRHLFKIVFSFKLIRPPFTTFHDYRVNPLAYHNFLRPHPPSGTFSVHKISGVSLNCDGLLLNDSLITDFRNVQRDSSRLLQVSLSAIRGVCDFRVINIGNSVFQKTNVGEEMDTTGENSSLGLPGKRIRNRPSSEVYSSHLSGK